MLHVPLRAPDQLPGRPATHRADLEAPCVAGPRGGSPVTVHGPGSRSLLPGARAHAGRLGCPRGAPALSRYLHITFVLAPSPCEELAAVPCARGAAGSVAGTAPRGGFEAGPGAPGPRAPGLEAPPVSGPAPRRPSPSARTRFSSELLVYP